MKRKQLAAAALAALLGALPALPAKAAPPSAALEDSVRTPANIQVKAYGDPVPVGTVMAWPASGAIPDGWLECNGTAVSSSDYPELAALTGGTLPDYRGLFLRGTGSGAAALGTLQLPSIKRHSHTFDAAMTRVLASSASSKHFNAAVSGGPLPAEGFSASSLERILSAQASLSESGTAQTAQAGSDTLNARPVHAAVRWIIKAKPAG